MCRGGRMSWKNSNFQIEHFILGEANGPWEKYRILKELLLDREAALATIKASMLKQQALIKAVEFADNEAAKLNAQASLAEFEAGLPILQRDIKFAQDEKDFIQSLIDGLKDELEGMRLPGYDDEKMFQHSQNQEWLLALKKKMRLELTCTGRLNPETLRVVQNHPQYKEILLPYLKVVRELLTNEPDRLLESGNLAIASEGHSGQGIVQ